ncbi:MAG TPA: integrase arm-type DNA-binding domain-containing protein [Rhizomicrobium sp.]|nr:integrase arm-type DNA-binding domain-containing protein [Rhizomicrobium sp.]
MALQAYIKSPPARQTDIKDPSVPGLSARITPKGHVTWSLRLRVAGEGGQSSRGRRVKGQQYRLTLGKYPTVSIKKARAKASEYLRQAEDGAHPVRALEKQAVGRHDTVENLIDTFIADYATPNLRSWKNAQSTLKRHVVPAWGKLPADSIDAREAARLLSDVARGPLHEKTGKRIPRPGAAGEVRKWGSLLFSWAVRNGLAQANPFEKSKNPAKLKPRQRFLDMAEIRAVWLAAASLEYPWRELIQLLILTACRLREIAHARWSWIDAKEMRVVIPPDAYKTERPFLVALPPQAIEILAIIKRWNEGDCVFSTTNGKSPVWSVSRKIVDRLHARAEKNLGRKIEHFVVHDFRRTVRTHLSRLGVSDVVGELALGHALRGVSKTYNVYDFEAEKREALARWASEVLQS